MTSTRFRKALSAFVTWVVLASLWVADELIRIMLLTRRDERRIRPTERIAWPKGLKRELMRRQDNTCTYCGYRRRAASLDIDHVIPVARGGSNDPSNLQVICRRCNQRKGVQTDEEFRARYSRLVPQRGLTPPRRRISQNEFREETRRTTEVDSTRQFRQTRFISKGSKVNSGCTGIGIGVAVVVLFLLASWGAEGYFLLIPSLILGGGTGFGIRLRAYVTGATIEDE